jgi:hypothetical protein
MSEERVESAGTTSTFLTEVGHYHPEKDAAKAKVSFKTSVSGVGKTRGFFKDVSKFSSFLQSAGPAEMNREPYAKRRHREMVKKVLNCGPPPTYYKGLPFKPGFRLFRWLSCLSPTSGRHGHDVGLQINVPPTLIITESDKMWVQTAPNGRIYRERFVGNWKGSFYRLCKSGLRQWKRGDNDKHKVIALSKLPSWHEMSATASVLTASVEGTEGTMEAQLKEPRGEKCIFQVCGYE